MNLPTEIYYLLVNLISISVPLALSFKFRGKFIQHGRAIAIAIAITAVFFLVWDVPFAKLGIWGFNPTYLLGAYAFGLPFEEYLFFVCIPFACLFSHYQMRIRKIRFSTRITKAIMYLLVAFCLALIVLYHDRTYTCTIAVMNLLAIAYCARRYNHWLTYFYLAYVIVILPFILVNGFLTGMATPDPIVWYDNLENMNVRIFTIPAEDFLYYHLLFLMNVYLFEHFKK